MKYIAIAIVILALVYVVPAAEINSKDIWYNKSVADYKNGSYLLALQNINKSLKEDPTDDYSWNLKVSILLKMGKYDTALSTINQALRANSSNAPLWNDRGLLEGEYLHDYNQSIRSLDRAIMLDLNNYKTYYNKGLVLKLAGRTEEADAAFAKAKDLGYKG